MSEKIYQATSDGSLQEVSLQEFVCHKVVRAAKIVAVGIGPEVPPDAPHGTRRGVRLALEGAAHVDVSQLWMQTKAAQPGGYFVQYEDGYSSFSPAKAFEEGYVLCTSEKPVEGDAAGPSAADLDAINADPATAGATGTKLLEFAKMLGGVRAADPAELKPTAPMPRDLPEGSLVTVKGGRGIQFKVEHCEQINGRRFVALDGLPQLFHESELIPVAEEPDTHAEEIADAENNHGQTSREPIADPTDGTAEGGAEAAVSESEPGPTSGSETEATDQTSSSEPSTSSVSDTESSSTHQPDSSLSQSWSMVSLSTESPSSEVPFEAPQPSLSTGSSASEGSAEASQPTAESPAQATQAE